jgi:hypothetical protein
LDETSSVLGLGYRFLHGNGHLNRPSTQITNTEGYIMIDYKKLALFVGGVLFGSAGFKVLSSKDAKKAYTHATAAALRAKDSVMETVTSVQENAADILASARDINEQRAAAETVVEDTSDVADVTDAAIEPVEV